MKLRAPTKPETQLTLLEVPPVNTEPERRYLSYNEMEERGKQFRDEAMEEGMVYVAGTQAHLHALASVGWFGGQNSGKGRGRELL